MRNICVHTLSEFIIALPLILSESWLRHRFTPWESPATAMGFAAGAQFHRRMRSPRRRRESHMWRCYTFYVIRCGKRVESTCARAKLRNYRRSADSLLGRYAICTRVRAREWDRERSAWKVTREITTTIRSYAWRYRRNGSNAIFGSPPRDANLLFLQARRKLLCLNYRKILIKEKSNSNWSKSVEH